MKLELQGRAPASAAEDAGDSEAREETRAVLQRRVGALGLIMAGSFGLFFVWRVIESLSEDDSPSQAFLPFQALGVAAFATLWLLCRKRPRSVRFLRATEILGLCAAGGAATAMCWRISYAARPDMVLLLCLTYTLIARAIMVPSTARRTFALGLFFAVPFLVSVYFIHLRKHDPSIYNDRADPRLHLPASTIAPRWTIVGGLWWAAALAIQTATSRVIYGLQRQVRDARRLGQYTLTEKLGQGGMGVVYRASHAMLRRPTAIKLLPPAQLGAERVARFEREVQLTARLSHPNTIRVFDYGRTPDGVFYYVMEYLEGADLEDVVAVGGPLPAGRVIHLLDQTAGALTEAHGIGLIHRDIKPANIFLTEQGGIPDVAKVLDFGLVKQLAGTEDETLAGPGVSRDDRLTGTPMYMAPEAISAPETVDGRTDLYSLGAVGYFLLTGQHVFEGRTVVEVCSHHLHSSPVPPSQRLGAAVPADLEALVLRCLEKDPAARPADARALQQALRACADANAWTEHDARRWLERHGAALRARQSRTVVRSPGTVAVDLGLRATDQARAAR